MSDRAEWWAHFAIAALCAAILWVVPSPFSWAIVIWMMGYLREVVQAQRKDASLRAFAFWLWSKHKRMEMWAWLVGAAVVGFFYGLARWI